MYSINFSFNANRPSKRICKYDLDVCSISWLPFINFKLNFDNKCTNFDKLRCKDVMFAIQDILKAFFHNLYWRF